MTDAYWPDPNTIRRRSKIIKYFILSQNIIREDIERIQEKLKTINWTEETLIERRKLRIELGKRYELDRIGRERIKWYKEDLLEKANLTG